MGNSIKLFWTKTYFSYLKIKLKGMHKRTVGLLTVNDSENWYTNPRIHILF